jgi:26S proteasome subunit RPN7
MCNVLHPYPTVYDLTILLNRLIEKGGDWDRRNRLKVYQALHTLSIRYDLIA